MTAKTSLLKLNKISAACLMTFMVATTFAQNSLQANVDSNGNQSSVSLENGSGNDSIFYGQPITPGAPHFHPSTKNRVVTTPTVSAYGTPIYYDQNGNPQPLPNNAATNRAAGNNQSALPPLPQVQQAPSLPKVTVEQALQAAGFFLSPEQIKELHKEIDEMGRAAAEDPSGRPPRSETSSVKVSLSPGSTPPVVRLYMNYPTSLVVVDNAGNPWPIENWVGGSTSIEIKRPIAKDSPNSASLTMTPRTPTGKFTHGGITLYLEGLAIPISLTYVGGQPVVDQRLEVRVPARGPNTSAPVYSGLGPSANPSLLSLLDGVPPHGASKLNVTTANAQAWAVGNRMFVRIENMEVISPGFFSSMKSANGTRVYEMEKITELRVMNNGEIESIKIDY